VTAVPPEASTIRVSFDATALPAEPRGAGRYVLELARALDRRNDVELVAFVRRDDPDRLDVRQRRAVAPRARPLRLAWEQVCLGRLVAREGVDVHHAPHYTMPVATTVAMVVTIHDLTFFDLPWVHQPIKARYFRRAIEHAARRADAIVCVSERTAQRLEALLRPRAPVFVVPHGVDHAHFSPAEPVPGADLEVRKRLLGELGDRPYVLALGTIEPRKNLPVLVAAFERLASSRPELGLVVAGGAGWGERALAEAIARAQHARRVAVVGWVPDDAVPALLRGAAVLAYPALAEGFGLPVLEAMACGTPVVTTADSAMADVADGAAWLVEHLDDERAPDALAEALEAAIEEGSEREARRARGLALAARCTWERSAEGHVAAYRAALAARAGRRGAVRGRGAAKQSS
jgi:glycosyltransferase involved in cell wall biosynthesis